MEHAPSPAPASGFSATVRGIAVASVSLGFFSMIVFWWKPFGGLLASVGFVLGSTSLLIGNRGSLRGDNLALIGTAMCGFSLSVIAALYFGLGYVQWGFAPW